MQFTKTSIDGWQKGPPPQGTWFWGGIVLEDSDPDNGFLLASFSGDHALIQEDGRFKKRVEFHDIAYWNNDLEWPIPKEVRERSGSGCTAKHPNC